VLDDATAVSIPPLAAESTRGPPEFPELMAASVWIRFWSVSPAPPVESPACTVRPVADTMPDVTVGVPAESPRAFPMAMTASTDLELGRSRRSPLEVGRRRVDLEQGRVARGSAPTRWPAVTRFVRRG